MSSKLFMYSGAVLILLLSKVLSQDISKEETNITEAKVDILKSSICNICTCNADVKQLDCSHKLSEWLSESAWNLLLHGDIIFETMKFEYNNLTNVPQLPAYDVKYLYLGFNQIESITSGAFQNLTQLVKLDLSHNKLNSKVLLPAAFEGLYSPQLYEPLLNLKSINLGYNELHKLHDDLFEHFPNLEELILCSNIIQVIDKQTEIAISSLNYLKTLDISYMEINTLPETLLHGPRELENLIMSGNLFTELPKSLMYALNLKSLVLDENPIGSLDGENVFPPMVNLKYLSMSYMPRLAKIGRGAISELQNLTELILSDNPMLSTIDTNAFSKNITGGNFLDYPPLEKIYLNNCKLTELSRSLIVRWDKVKVLDLRFNPWNCDTRNEWIMKIILPQIKRNAPLLVENVKCATPDELRGIVLLDVTTELLTDSLGRSHIFWIGLCSTLLIIVAITYIAFVLYNRHCHSNGFPYNRSVYNRARLSETFHI